MCIREKYINKMLPTNEILCRASPMQAIIGMLVMYCDAVNKKDSKKQYRNYRQGVNRSTKMPVRLLL